MLLTMSPGTVALLPGRFSTAGTTTLRLTGSCSAATVAIVPITPAAPHMSNFISSMAGPGFREMPPESKVTPLPTSTMGFDLPPFLYCMTMSLAGSLVPAVTDSSECMPRRFMSGSLITRVVSLPLPFASFCAVRAR